MTAMPHPESMIVGNPTLDEKSWPDVSQSNNDANRAGVKDFNHEESEPQHVTGIKLVLIVASVALACFLMLVDTMVISTVSQH